MLLSSSDIAQIGHNGRQLRSRLLTTRLPPGTRGRHHRRLEVPDRLGPQNQVLQEHDTLQELTKDLNKSGRVRKPFMRLMVLASKNSYPIVLRNRHRGHKYEL